MSVLPKYALSAAVLSNGAANGKMFGMMSVIVLSAVEEGESLRIRSQTLSSIQ